MAPAWNNRGAGSMRYTYECNGCNKRYEVDMKLSECNQRVKCPYCKKIIKKVLTPVRFKVN